MKRILCLVVMAALALVSCEKEAQLPGSAAGFVFVHASSGAGNALVTISGEEVVSSGLAYGESTVVAGQPYISTGAGIRNVTVSSATDNIVPPFNTVLSKNSLFSFWLYDTLTAGGKRKQAVLLLQDRLNAVNDSVHFRFLHLATEKDGIALRLVDENNTGDTLRVSDPLPLPLDQAAAPFLSPFRHFLKDGTYKVELLDGDGAVIQTRTGFSIAKGTYTTFYTSGAYQSSSATPFSLNFVQHR